MGIRALRKLQLGLEATAGTVVAADTIWRGMGTLEDQRRVQLPEEDVAYISGTDRSYIDQVLAALTMESVEATFEQLPIILSCGMSKDEDGAADGVGSGKVYSFAMPTTADAAVSTATIEAGDDQRVDEMEYAFVESFTLEGKGGEALKVSAEWKGRQLTDAEFTAALTLPSVEEILFSKGKCYIDAVTGTIGTTQKSATLLGMRLNVTTGLQPHWTADGQLYFTFTRRGRPEVTLDLTMEHNGTAEAEIANHRAQTPRQVRLAFEGSALTSAGTYSKKTLILDLAGKWQKFGKLDEQNGNDVVTGTLVARYNADAALFFEAVVVNEVASL